MYKLEERILFDAAAVADVADAQQEAEAQEEVLRGRTRTPPDGAGEAPELRQS